jgi:hypothetical protein
VYNPISRISHFLKLFRNNAQYLKNSLSSAEVTVLPPHALMLAKTIKECFGSPISEKERKHILAISAKIKTVWEAKYHLANADYRTIEDFYKDYCDWLIENADDSPRQIFFYGPGTREWSRFLKNRGLDEVIIDNK